MLIKSLVAVFLAAILTENYVLSKFLGICPFLGVSKKLNTAVGMSVAVTFVMVLATAVTFPIYTYLLVPMGLEYLQTVLFILVIAGLVQLVEIILRKHTRCEGKRNANRTDGRKDFYGSHLVAP